MDNSCLIENKKNYLSKKNQVKKGLETNEVRSTEQWKKAIWEINNIHKDGGQ